MHRTNSQHAWLRLVVVTIFVSLIGLSLCLPGSFSRWRVAASQPTVVYKTYGLNFSPYIDGQDPNLGSVISEAQLTTRMQIIANHTVWVRSFGSTHGLEKFGMVAHSLGLKAAVGAWLSSDLAANSQEISNLISAAQAGQVDLAIVGSEVLLRNDLSESQLIAYMNQVRQQIPANVPVATADVYGKLLEHPAVIANSDVVLPNYYPYWEGVSINTSIATLHRQHQLVVAAAQGKPVIVSETGWPSAGNVICNAVPSPANASLYFLNFVSWARANNVSYFYFTSLSEAWKANYEGPQGAHWGVWTKDGVLKPGMQDVFDGLTMPDNWTSAGVPGGPGTPSMEFAYVPPYGSSNNLFGQVLHVNTDDHKIAVYIYVGGWWTKPTFATPLTNIGLDGSWECDITTGGNDALATQIVAFLVPKNYSPPPMSGGQTLPPALDQNAVARTEIARSSSSPYIAGQVTDSSNHGLNCVTISLTGSQTTTTHTLSNGNYSFLNLPLGGNYTVTPSHPSYTFNPLSWTFNNLSSSQTRNFVALANYSISLSASPSAGGNVSGSGTFAAGTLRTVTATANSNYTFANWTENGNVVSTSANYTFTLNGSRSLIANFTSSQMNVSVTVQANPLGRGFTVDGILYASPQLFTWASGSSHMISITSPQGGGTGTQYMWSNWSDGGGMSHSISPTNNATYTASFTTQYLLTVNAGTGGTVSPESNWFNTGQAVTISASPASGFSFSGWTGSGSGSFTGASNPASVTMNGPITETASFNQLLSTNFARSANGGTASASSTTPNSGFPGYNFLPSVAIDGDRRSGVNFWRDDTANAYPDSLQVDFNGTKNITEIDVITIQDNDQNPADPTLGMTFVEDGIIAFDVQYWTGSAWVTVPNGSVTGNNKVWRQFTFSSISTSKVRVQINNALNARSRIVELEAWGTASSSNSNQALAANGGLASASSTTPNSGFPGYNFLPSVAIDGDRRSGVNFWRDNTPSAYPDWLQVDFNGSKNITEIDVFTMQDNDQNPSDPTLVMTFVEDGITAFDVQYWTGSAWATVPNGSVTGNNKVWRHFTFSSITTSKVRVLVNNALNTRSRVVELEAWGTSSSSNNQALASNGGIASASSTTPNSGFPGYNFLPSVAIDGDRRSGVNFWRDDTPSTYPDWLQVDFSGTKNITEIDVFTMQDNDQNPAEPTLGMTFTEDGITAFEVQYWTGAAWITVPNGSVTGNNKIWRQFTFSPIATSKIRVLVNNALNTRSRIVELEAY